MADSTTNRSTHILQASATMVGVCMTAVSIVRVLHRDGPVVGPIVALDSLVFLVSSFTSYLVLRGMKGARGLETIAEMLFLLGLSVLAVAAIIVSFEIGSARIR